MSKTVKCVKSTRQGNEEVVLLQRSGASQDASMLEMSKMRMMVKLIWLKKATQ